MRSMPGAARRRGASSPKHASAERQAAPDPAPRRQLKLWDKTKPPNGVQGTWTMNRRGVRGRDACRVESTGPNRFRGKRRPRKEIPLYSVKSFKVGIQH